MIVEIQENDSMECTGNDYKISVLKVGCDQINPGGLIIIFFCYFSVNINCAILIKDYLCK